MRYEDYLDEGYEPSQDELVCVYRVKHDSSVSFEWAAGGIAAESSIGTWDPDLVTMSGEIEEKRARVFETDRDEGLIRIAYPLELFEKGNIPQILSSIAGNIFGLEELNRLRLEDVNFPREMKISFLGPQLGISGVRKYLNVQDRPLVGTIVKPKLGLNEIEHSNVAYEAWKGGLDIVKDDENLASMEFNNFKTRVSETLSKKEKAETETGEKKVYFPNITSSSDEMKERADFVIEKGGKYVMVDILTTGWSSLQQIREYLEGKEIGIHAHRAQHAAFTRLKDHGISMLSVAKLARMAGVDNLHAGTVIGKMEGEREEVLQIYDYLRSEDSNLKRTIPVASGGLHPGLVSDLIEIFGKNTVIQAGGGVHGHPEGTFKGAKALRDSVEAIMNGYSLEEYGEKSSALFKALKKWGKSV